MACSVGKEDVFEKRHRNTFWNCLDFNNGDGVVVKEKQLASYFISKHPNHRFAALWRSYSDEKVKTYFQINIWFNVDIDLSLALITVSLKEVQLRRKPNLGHQVMYTYCTSNEAVYTAMV